MPDRISIPALREHAALESDPDQPRAIYQDELLALVEAVEAAQAYRLIAQSAGAMQTRLDAALARFDFGEPIPDWVNSDAEYDSWRAGQ